MAVCIREALPNPDFALYRIEEKAHQLSFVLVPLSLPILWLLFASRRDIRMFDYVVSALYSLLFMSLLAVAIGLLQRAGHTFGTLASMWCSCRRCTCSCSYVKHIGSA